MGSLASTIKSVSFDAADALTPARFWAALGSVTARYAQLTVMTDPGGDECSAEPGPQH